MLAGASNYGRSVTYVAGNKERACAKDKEEGIELLNKEQQE